MYVLQCILCNSERKCFRIYAALQIKIIFIIIILEYSSSEVQHPKSFVVTINGGRQELSLEHGTVDSFAGTQF